MSPAASSGEPARDPPGREAPRTPCGEWLKSQRRLRPDQGHSATFTELYETGGYWRRSRNTISAENPETTFRRARAGALHRLRDGEPWRAFRPTATRPTAASTTVVEAEGLGESCSGVGETPRCTAACDCARAERCPWTRRATSGSPKSVTPGMSRAERAQMMRPYPSPFIHVSERAARSRSPKSSNSTRGAGAASGDGASETSGGRGSAASATGRSSGAARAGAGVALHAMSSTALRASAEPALRVGVALMTIGRSRGSGVADEPRNVRQKHGGRRMRARTLKRSTGSSSRARAPQSDRPRASAVTWACSCVWARLPREAAHPDLRVHVHPWAEARQRDPRIR